MGTQHAQADPVEQDLAAAQLEDMALANAGRSWVAWKDVVLRWHMESVARARAEAWLPGAAGSQDPVVEEALNRFYRHHMRVAIGHLRAENLELRRKLLEALACARFYASGASDAGERAHSILAELERYAAHAGPEASQSHQDRRLPQTSRDKPKQILASKSLIAGPTR